MDTAGLLNKTAGRRGRGLRVGFFAVAILFVLMALNSFDHSSAPPAEAGLATAVSSTNATEGQHHGANHDTQHPGNGTCVGCAGFHTGMTSACVIALLLVITMILPPQVLPLWRRAQFVSAPMPIPVFHRMASARPFEFLCISRT